MKKITASLLALMVCTTIIANSFKANAVAVPASLLAYLIQACAEVLVGSGTVTQQQFNDMSVTDVFDTTQSALPNIDLEADAKMKIEFMKKFNSFVNDSIHEQIDFVSDGGIDNIISDFILHHADSLGMEYDTSVLGGAGCSVKLPYNSNTGSSRVIYGAYGVLNANGTYTIFNPVRIDYFSQSGELKFSQDKTTSSSLSATCSDGYIYYGDWRYPDGTQADSIITELPTIDPTIGTVDVDGKTYDVNGDGTVTIDDTTYTINDDGSVTIGDNTYYPDYDLTPYDDTAIKDLLTDILNSIDVVDDTATDEADKVIDDAFVDAPAIANSELSNLMLPKTISTVFPFCIPRDFYTGIKLLSAEPEAPKFEVPFEIPEYGSFPGVKKMIVIDFSKYSSAFAVVRWVNYILFMFAICFITFKIVKGV